MATKAKNATKAAPKAATKKAKANGAVKARTTFNPEHKIHVLVKDNPKRKNTKEAKRFDKYRNGMTVAQAYEVGMNALNLSRDIERKCIKVGG
jgi:hypothetical protein